MSYAYDWSVRCAPYAYKFTGQERDAELAGSAMQGLDYFGARYFSGAQGRFTSPDPKVHPAQSEAGAEVFLSEAQDRPS